jgi:hypothetical protein
MKIIFSSLLLLVFFLQANAQKREKCIINLEKKLAPEFNKKAVEGEVVNIKDNLKCINWDSLIVVMAISKKESIEKDAGIKIPYDFNNEFFSSYGDSDAMIIFLKNKIAVSHIIVKETCRQDQVCKTFDFLDLLGNNPYTFVDKKDAIFEVYTKEVINNQGKKFTWKNAIRLKK